MSHRAAGWHIRLRTTSDHAGIEAVFKSCLVEFPWRRPETDEVLRLRRTLSGCDCLVAHEAQAGIIGFLTLEREKAYVAHLFVHDDWRLCGVASGLLAVARDLARASLQLDVDEQNQKALKAYKAMGWTEKVGANPARGGQRRLSGP
ncbi:GNAT family N-acetyltransferase [Henriciella aquimarina]|uniref:GNAT family N-acetyltransferase n=1 Tax=Henriciella aquimarina TaxID=545261 RepID=UPI001301FF17|nr:GNAT family N-acetyltransferase [Henriciella aquimarina]